MISRIIPRVTAVMMARVPALRAGRQQLAGERSAPPRHFLPPLLENNLAIC
jgi:hypothetical protein